MSKVYINCQTKVLRRGKCIGIEIFIFAYVLYWRSLLLCYLSFVKHNNFVTNFLQVVHIYPEFIKVLRLCSMWNCYCQRALRCSHASREQVTEYIVQRHLVLLQHNMFIFRMEKFQQLSSEVVQFIKMQARIVDTALFSIRKWLTLVNYFNC